MSFLTWQQIALAAVVFTAIIVAAKFVPEAVTPVTSIAFTVVGSQFLTKKDQKNA